jgi:hypothetical protein
MRGCHLNQSCEYRDGLVVFGQRFIVGSKVFEMKFDRLSSILRRLFDRASVRDATRKRRDQDRVTARLFRNQADLIGKHFLAFTHDSIMPT